MNIGGISKTFLSLKSIIDEKVLKKSEKHGHDWARESMKSLLKLPSHSKLNVDNVIIEELSEREDEENYCESIQKQISNLKEQK